MFNAICIIFFLFNGTVDAQTDTLSFLHITDLHTIFNQPGYLDEMIESRKLKLYDQGENRLRNFLQTMPEKTGSDMVIATGDLVDFFEANTATEQNLNVQIVQFSRLLDDYRTPVFLALGNHDLFSFNWANNKLKHHQNNSGSARAAWIRNVHCFKNGTYYSELFQVGTTTYRFIFLDNAFYKFQKDEKYKVPCINDAQRYWLSAQLNESDDDIEIVFMHIPMKSVTPDENYSNQIYSVLKSSPNAKLILAGHRHKNLVDYFPVGDNSKMVQVQTGSLVQGPDNWRLVRLTEDKIFVSAPGRSGEELVIPVK
ncbi:metallophosphoesterase family protein [Mariniphaga anaerophila]|nr:metallophosphoesterase [Mariniphaga anaerophila]